MGMLAWTFGIIGGLCAVMGIITAAEVIPVLIGEFTAMFWMVLSAILMLITIAFAVGSGSSYE
jgi:hypothetical protein